MENQDDSSERGGKNLVGEWMESVAAQMKLPGSSVTSLALVASDADPMRTNNRVVFFHQPQDAERARECAAIAARDFLSMAKNLDDVFDLGIFQRTGGADDSAAAGGRVVYEDVVDDSAVAADLNSTRKVH